MPAPVVEVQGRQALVASMKAAGVALTDLNAANKAAADVVAPVASGRSPRRTGRLAASVRPSGTRTAAQVRVGSKAVPYAGPVHFGWPGHNIEPNPFAFQAAQQTEPEWTGVYEREIDKILDRVHGV